MKALISRDLRLSFARGSEGLAALFFFFAVAMLFPFALGAEPETLRKAAPGILWIAALLAALLSLEAVWHRDFEDGTFDLLYVSGAEPVRLCLAKTLAHWLLTGPGLIAAALLMSRMLYMPAETLCTLLSSLFFGTLYMSLLGGLGAALTFGARRPGLLLALLVLPLFVPMLILGVMAGAAALAGEPARPYLLLQLALVIAALPLAPLGAARLIEMQVRT
jgi:heme exporter protein B